MSAAISTVKPDWERGVREEVPELHASVGNVSDRLGENAVAPSPFY
jgi:hypothetical protein